jgi:MFS family permease
MEKHSSPFVAFQYRDYRLLWLGQATSQIGTNMRLAAIGWQIYLLTRDPLSLGTVALCRIVPLILMSLIGGSVADALDRRRVLIVSQSLLLFFSSVLALVTVTGAANLWWIYGIVIVTSAVNAFERPAYSALVPALVPREVLPNAISLNTMNWQLGMVLGPGLGGLGIAAFGVAGVYTIDAASYLAVIASLLLISHRADKAELGGRGKISVGVAVEGLRFVFSNRILVSVMLLDFFATFFASASTLLPIVATELLKTGEVGFGILASAESFGALTMSLIMAWINVNRINRPGVVLLVAVFCYSFFTVLFGLSEIYILSFVLLALVGASDTVSMVLRQTIAQLVTPNEMRGRMLSVNMIFFAGGPQLGEMEAGIVARLVGVRASIISGGIACGLIVLAISAFSERLRDYKWQDPK